jgi:hypothetical protein
MFNTQPIDETPLPACQNLLRQIVKVAEDPKKKDAVAKRRPDVSWPDGCLNAQHAR